MKPKTAMGDNRRPVASVIRRGGRTPPGPSDTVPAMIAPGRGGPSREVARKPEGGRPAALTPGEIVLSKADRRLLEGMMREYRDTGKVDGKKPPPALAKIMERLMDEGVEGFCKSGRVGFEGGGLVGWLKNLGKSKTQLQTERDLAAMRAGTYQGQQAAPTPSPSSTPGPETAIASATPPNLGNAYRAFKSRAQEIDAAAGFALGGLVPDEWSDWMGEKTGGVVGTAPGVLDTRKRMTAMQGMPGESRAWPGESRRAWPGESRGVGAAPRPALTTAGVPMAQDTARFGQQVAGPSGIIGGYSQAASAARAAGGGSPASAIPTAMAPQRTQTPGALNTYGAKGYAGSGALPSSSPINAQSTPNAFSNRPPMEGFQRGGTVAGPSTLTPEDIDRRRFAAWNQLKAGVQNKINAAIDYATGVGAQMFQPGPGKFNIDFSPPGSQYDTPHEIRQFNAQVATTPGVTPSAWGGERYVPAQAATATVPVEQKTAIISGKTTPEKIAAATGNAQAVTPTPQPLAKPPVHAQVAKLQEPPLASEPTAMGPRGGFAEDRSRGIRYEVAPTPEGEVSKTVMGRSVPMGGSFSYLGGGRVTHPDGSYTYAAPGGGTFTRGPNKPDGSLGEIISYTSPTTELADQRARAAGFGGYKDFLAQPNAPAMGGGGAGKYLQDLADEARGIGLGIPVGARPNDEQKKRMLRAQLTLQHMAPALAGIEEAGIGAGWRGRGQAMEWAAAQPGMKLQAQQADLYDRAMQGDQQALAMLGALSKGKSERRTTPIKVSQPTGRLNEFGQPMTQDAIYEPETGTFIPVPAMGGQQQGGLSWEDALKRAQDEAWLFTPEEKITNRAMALMKGGGQPMEATRKQIIESGARRGWNEQQSLRAWQQAGGTIK